MPTRVAVDDDEQQIQDLIKEMRRLRSRLATTGVKGTHDEFTAAATPATTYTLTYIPLTGTCLMALNGHVQREGTDYTCDYDTGIITVTATQAAGDKITFRYLVTDWLIARSLAPDVGGLTDNFNRADSATTINPASDGNSWIVYNMTWGTTSNKGYRVNTTGTTIEPIFTNPGGPGNFITSGFLGYDLGAAIQTVQVELHNTSASIHYNVYTNVDLTAGSAYFVDITNNTATVYRATNWSAFTTIGTLTLASWIGSGGVFGNGITTVKMHHDGAGHLSFWQDNGSGLTSIGTFTDGSPLTATNMMFAVNASSTNVTFDNFSATPS